MSTLLDIHCSNLRLVDTRQGIVVFLADVLTLGIRIAFVNQCLFDNVEGLCIGTCIYREAGIVQLVITHILIILATDEVTRTNGVLSVVVIVVCQRACSIVVSVVFYRLLFAVRSLVVSVDITLAMIVFINQHV